MVVASAVIVFLSGILVLLEDPNALVPGEIVIDLRRDARTRLAVQPLSRGR
jgi:hypothetical protein